MDNSEKFEFLEQERLKIWAKVAEIEKAINENLTAYESQAHESAKRTNEFASQAESAKNTSIQNLNEINNKLEEFRTQFSSFQQLHAHFDGLSRQSNENAAEVQTLHDLVVEQERSLKSKVGEIEKLLDGKPLLEEKLNTLEGIYSRGNDYDSRLSALNTAINERKKEIDKLYFSIIGYKEINEETGEETIVHGLKSELESSYVQLKGDFEQLSKDVTGIKDEAIKNYKDFAEKKETDYTNTMTAWKSEYANVVNKLQELLPNALTAGLSYAYEEKRKVEVLESVKLEGTFIKAIWGLVCISLIPFALSIYAMFVGTPLQVVIERIPREVLAILPLYIPVIWVAYSSNRKMNLSKRLIEEYSHKEALSKTFEGLSSQINNIPDKDISAELRTKLLFTLLEVNSENPGKLISDYNKSDHPVMDTLEKSMKLTESLDKLSKIPGVDKLAEFLQKRSNSLLADGSKKVEEGLDMVGKGELN